MDTAAGDTGAKAAAALCSADQLVDYAHISKSPPRAVQAHGWWRNVNCKATLAKVTVQVQKKNVLGLWVDVGQPGSSTVASGGGAGNRATARYTCNGTGTHTFRAWVDVDIVGVADLPNKTYSGAQTLACN